MTEPLDRTQRLYLIIKARLRSDLDRQTTGRVGKAQTDWMRHRRPLAGPRGPLP